ncbi:MULTISPECIES: ABC transporter permease [unclassified Kitasatospora]|uniref:ABC transporter permease n=1 Tax=unclassified Kitasatospora TaxID=2633591 RepID=UPI000709F3A4|nr:MULTISPECIES: ABC transporter permease [unclassified Kitasatospora]KQV04628.1 peptide ABC transporter permease [Kitasatospora sp. Root107]KRB60847.1 peptide ABC transporter permease [Kitasatospora sp. Root187]
MTTLAVGLRRRRLLPAGLHTLRGTAGVLLVGVVVLAGLLAPLLTDADPLAQSGLALAGPSGAHPFGTDDLGRDLFSRVLHGIRTDLLISVTAVPVGAVLGCALALLAATSRGADVAVQRVFDLLLAFPGLILALAVTAVLGPGRWPVVIVIALAEIPGFGRQLRAGILVQREREYALAARVGGASRARVLLRHVLPNAVDPLIVQGAIAFSLAVFIEGAMSFLGVGVRPPEPSLGGILSQSMAYLSTHPGYAAAPLLVVTALVLGLTLIAEALNEGIRR